jgi:hypothetical protein
MKKIIAGLVFTVGFMGGMFLLVRMKPSYSENSLHRCRVNKVVEELPHGGITPDIRYRLTTDEGYVVFSYNKEFRVGDSIDVQVVKINK